MQKTQFTRHRLTGAHYHRCDDPRCCTALSPVLAKPLDFMGVSAGTRAVLIKRKLPRGYQAFAPPFCDGARPVSEVKENERPVAGEDPIISGMAGRYATALFELALENKATDAIKADLDRFDAMIDESPDLRRLVRSPVFDADEQLRALSAILDKAGIKGLAANFLRVLVTNRRLFAVRDVVRGYRALIARHKGEVTAQVTVAEPLSDKNREALKDALKSVTGGKDIDFDVKVDPAIIGGLIVKVGSRMVDSSLRTKLNAIKIAMKEAR